MDLNYLLQREQIERVRADRAGDERARRTHSDLADSYRALFETHRRSHIVAVGLGLDPRVLTL